MTPPREASSTCPRAVDINPSLDPECPICNEISDGEQHQCRNGCIFCASCDGRLPSRRCPLCRVQLAPPSHAIRCRIQERIIASLPASCEYCLTAINRGALADHRRCCPQRPAGENYQEESKHLLVGEAAYRVAPSPGNDIGFWDILAVEGGGDRARENVLGPHEPPRPWPPVPVAVAARAWSAVHGLAEWAGDIAVVAICAVGSSRVCDA